MTKKTKLFVWLSILGLGVGTALIGDFVLAQDFGAEAVSIGLDGSLSTADPRAIIGTFIQIALSFLGALAVVLVMYAGFLWMTSGGDEEKISRAKAILRNGVVGFIIILASWGIATFIITRLGGAVSGVTPPDIPPSRPVLSSPGLGAFGACSVESVYPAPGQNNVPRNTAIMVTFKEEVKLDSVCVNSVGSACSCDNGACSRINPVAIRLFNSDLTDACNDDSCASPNGNVTAVRVNVASGNKTLVLTPDEHLGSVNGDTPYTVKFTSALRKKDDRSMFTGCSSNATEWDFEVSNILDLAPPLVAPSGIFPLPDNEEDLFLQVTPAVPATGVITVNACPKIYAPANVIGIDGLGNSPEATVVLDYDGPLDRFNVTVPAGAPNKAQLFDANGNLLGLADFSSAGSLSFPNFFTLTAEVREEGYEGSSWDIKISPQQLADTLTVGGEVYTFSTAGLNNNIEVPPVCNTDDVAFNIQSKLHGAVLEINREANRLSLKAAVAGTGGNDILINSNSSALAIQPLNGGRNRIESSESRDRKDRPMNSALQINFNEPVNPLTVSGTAAEVKDYIRVVNAVATSSPAGAVCSVASDCKSYRCENGSCVSDFLDGKFMVSNAYKTLEFISDKKCGVNGCGEDIYCLPADSHLSVELVAADLESCSSDADCQSFAPFRSCLENASLGHKTCQDGDSKNYPLAKLDGLNGIVDAALNSLDGDRDSFADGPYDFYNDNFSPPANIGRKDKYKWSFYINDQILLTAPEILDISPRQGQPGASSTAPIAVTFNRVMLNSSLRSGRTVVSSGTSTQEHKLVNLSSVSPIPLGYWITNDNIDIDMPASGGEPARSLDGEPDITITNIWHSPFPESLSFRAQIGSGVKDIYQNCYKPSEGPGQGNGGRCQTSPDQPSCCYGLPVGELGPDGSCM